jgi:hypothetical protein
VVEIKIDQKFLKRIRTNDPVFAQNRRLVNHRHWAIPKFQRADQVDAAATAPPYTSLTKRWVPGEFLSFTRMFRFGHDLLIPTEVGDIQETRLFLIDTGGPRNLLSVNVAREIRKVHLNSRMTLYGLSGSVNKVYGAEKTELHFDHVRQYAENQTAIDLEHLSDRIETEISQLKSPTGMVWLLERIYCTGTPQDYKGSSYPSRQVRTRSAQLLWQALHAGSEHRG